MWRRPIDWLVDIGHTIWLGSAGTAPRGECLYVDATGGESAGQPTRTADLPRASPGVTRIVCVSDTHELHEAVDMPTGHVLLVAGDIMALNRHFSRGYARAKLRRFARWLRAQPHATKVVIGGNHDAVLESLGADSVQRILAGGQSAGGEGSARSDGEKGAESDESIVYLQDRGTVIGGGLSVWGSPYSRGSSKNDAFQSGVQGRLDAIPRRAARGAQGGGEQKQRLDVLLTHGPLPEAVLREVAPRLYLNGHIHEAHGVRWLRHAGVGGETAGDHATPCLGLRQAFKTNLIVTFPRAGAHLQRVADKGDTELKDDKWAAETLALRAQSARFTRAIARANILSDAVPGASRWYVGSAGVYSAKAATALLPSAVIDASGMMDHANYAGSDVYVESKRRFVRTVSTGMRDRFGATYCVAESGTAGPEFYIDGITEGFTAVAVCGPQGVLREAVVRTGHADRKRNMEAFARAALQMLAECLEEEARRSPPSKL
eukprot:g940.t1